MRIENYNYNKVWSQTHEDFLENFIIKTDSYKVTQWSQYPSNVSKFVSYLESRGCSVKRPDGTDLYSYSSLVGLQGVCLRHLTGQQITYKKIEQARELCKAHFGRDLVNVEGWNAIVENYNGFLPLIIRGVEEGERIPLKNVLMTVENVDDSHLSRWIWQITMMWLTNYTETLLSQVWHPSSVFTNSLHLYDVIESYHLKTVGENSPLVPFSMQNFGARGASSYETSCIGDMAHLSSGFMGTDAICGIVYANKTYGEFGSKSGINSDYDSQFTMYGYSVFATEHSTTTINGRHGERDFIIKCLKENLGSIVSMVGDSYSIRKFTRLLGEDETIRNLIIKNGELGGKFVLRPDSEDPTKICLELIEILFEMFGVTINEKGFMELPKFIGLLQGDGINLLKVEELLEAYYQKTYSANNIIFGSGGALVQKFDRDTLKFAIKGCYAVRKDGSIIKIQKEPEGEPFKKSKLGLPMLIKTENSYITKEDCTYEEFNSDKNELKVVFDSGVLKRYISLNQIRENAKKRFNSL